MTLTGSLDTRVEDDRVAFAFTVTNDGEDDTHLSFRDACTADFAVIDGDDERWRWSKERMFAQMLQSEELAPGESVTYEGEWTNPPSGSYTAVATLEAESHDCEARTDLSV